MPPTVTIERFTLEKLLAHAADAARILGHLDSPAVVPIADHVDAIAHDLTELLGCHRRVTEPVPSARPTFGSDVVTQRIESLTMAALVESGDR